MRGWGLGIATPRVGLLSIGEEPSKGNELGESHRMLKASLSSFIGNVEAARRLPWLAT